MTDGEQWNSIDLAGALNGWASFLCVCALFASLPRMLPAWRPPHVRKGTVLFVAVYLALFINWYGHKAWDINVATRYLISDAASCCMILAAYLGTTVVERWPRIRPVAKTVCLLATVYLLLCAWGMWFGGGRYAELQRDISLMLSVVAPLALGLAFAWDFLGIAYVAWTYAAMQIPVYKFVEHSSGGDMLLQGNAYSLAVGKIVLLGVVLSHYSNSVAKNKTKPDVPQYIPAPPSHVMPAAFVLTSILALFGIYAVRVPPVETPWFTFPLTGACVFVATIVSTVAVYVQLTKVGGQAKKVSVGDDSSYSSSDVAPPHSGTAEEYYRLLADSIESWRVVDNAAWVIVSEELYSHVCMRAGQCPVFGVDEIIAQVCASVSPRLGRDCREEVSAVVFQARHAGCLVGRHKDVVKIRKDVRSLDSFRRRIGDALLRTLLRRVRYDARDAEALLNLAAVTQLFYGAGWDSSHRDRVRYHFKRLSWGYVER